jgi:hypothetical protein
MFRRKYLKNHNIGPRTEANFTPPPGGNKKTVHGILGMHDLPLGKVLIVATKKVRLTLENILFTNFINHETGILGNF